MMRHLLLVHRPEEWPSINGHVEIVSTKKYLTDPSYAAGPPAKVVNLDRSYQYQSVGYYASLLASARSHKVIPSVSAIQDLKSRATLRLVGEDVENVAKKAFESLRIDRFVVECFFGRTHDERFSRLGRALFGHFQVPLLRANFRRKKDQWALHSASPIPPADLSPADRAIVAEMVAHFFSKGAPRARLDKHAYDMAILVNPKEGESAPSNAQALARFAKAGEAIGLSVDFIEKDDFGRLGEYDALFIRATTAVDHYTYRFARRGAAEGLVVIDDPDSILRCTNKVFLAELLQRHGLPHPKTTIFDRSTVEQAAIAVKYPCILKTPDGAFSKGVIRVDDKTAFEREARHMLESSELILAQQFVPTDFDWRIGVLGGKPLFACKYYMAKGHWQVYNYGSKVEEAGGHEAVDFSEVPPAVLDVALRATQLIGRGLYGVDMKEIDGKPQVIEVNDNPNIEVGCEDEFLGAELYNRVMKQFLEWIRVKKESRR